MRLLKFFLFVSLTVFLFTARVSAQNYNSLNLYGALNGFWISNCFTEKYNGTDEVFYGKTILSFVSNGLSNPFFYQLHLKYSDPGCMELKSMRPTAYSGGRLEIIDIKYSQLSGSPLNRNFGVHFFDLDLLPIYCSDEKQVFLELLRFSEKFNTLQIGDSDTSEVRPTKLRDETYQKISKNSLLAIIASWKVAEKKIPFYGACGSEDHTSLEEYLKNFLGDAL